MVLKIDKKSGKKVSAKKIKPAVAEDLQVLAIKKILKRDVAPRLAMHEGGIEFVSFDKKSGVVQVKMQGACQGCPMASVTMESLVEGILKESVAGVRGVVGSSCE